MSEIADKLRKHYGGLISIARSPFRTVHEFNIKVGSVVYYRIHQYSPKVAHLTALLPKWKIGQVEKILGPSSLVISDKKTKKLINRHLTDVSPLKAAAMYPGHYQNTEMAMKNAINENMPDLAFDDVTDDVGMEEQEIRDEACADVRKNFELNDKSFMANPTFKTKSIDNQNVRSETHSTPLDEKIASESSDDDDALTGVRLRRSKRLKDKQKGAKK